MLTAGCGKGGTPAPPRPAPGAALVTATIRSVADPSQDTCVIAVRFQDGEPVAGPPEGLSLPEAHSDKAYLHVSPGHFAVSLIHKGKVKVTKTIRLKEGDSLELDF